MNVTSINSTDTGKIKMTRNKLFCLFAYVLLTVTSNVMASDQRPVVKFSYDSATMMVEASVRNEGVEDIQFQWDDSKKTSLPAGFYAKVSETSGRVLSLEYGETLDGFVSALMLVSNASVAEPTHTNLAPSEERKFKLELSKLLSGFNKKFSLDSKEFQNYCVQFRYLVRLADRSLTPLVFESDRFCP